MRNFRLSSDGFSPSIKTSAMLDIFCKGMDPLPASTFVLLISTEYFFTTLEDSCFRNFSAIFSSFDDALRKRAMVKLSVWMLIGVR